MPIKHEIGEILTEETARQHIGEMVLVWGPDVEDCDLAPRKLVAFNDGFWCEKLKNNIEAVRWTHAALPAKPKPKLWVGDPVMIPLKVGSGMASRRFKAYAELGIMVSEYGFLGCCPAEYVEIWRLPTRAELEAAGYPAEQVSHLMERWGCANADGCHA